MTNAREKDRQGKNTARNFDNAESRFDSGPNNVIVLSPAKHEIIKGKNKGHT